jgi:hypothetical protein
MTLADKSGFRRVEAVNRATVRFLAALILLLNLSARAFAGPPYITDDPEPVEYGHWEIYFGSQFIKQSDTWTSTAPHLEVDYGPLPNVQLAVIAPMILYAPTDGPTNYGYGDTQLGIKFRFIQESKWRPQIATYPQLEIPTGSRDQNLGSGSVQTFLPLWLQKSVGKWTAYGGGGYWINPGPGNRNWFFTGLVVERQVWPNFTPGLEIFHGTSQQVGGPRETGINLGLTWDFSETHHIVFSTGPALEGSNQLQGYLAYELTLGPNS